MEYEVLSPWAEVDPLPVKGNSPRIPDLNGKTIGLFANMLPWSPEMLEEVARQLKERFPNAKFSPYQVPEHVHEVYHPKYKESFEKWVRGIDAAVTAYGI